MFGLLPIMTHSAMALFWLAASALGQSEKTSEVTKLQFKNSTSLGVHTYHSSFCTMPVPVATHLAPMLSTSFTKSETQRQSDFEDEPISSKSLHSNLLCRARLLLAELTAFQSYLQAQRKEDTVVIRQFLSGVQSETRSLERIANIISNEGLIAQDDNDAVETRRLHVLQSSNLPFYEVVWQVAIRREGVLALGMKNRRVRSVSLANGKVSPGHNCTPLGQAGAACKTKNVVKRKDASAADIVADDGGTWIKVSTITEKRLLFEMAKEGWEGYEDESSEDHTDSDVGNKPFPGASHHQVHCLELVRLAEDLMEAACAVRVRYRHPRIQFILPRIFEGRIPEIDSVIQDLRKTGAKVQCAVELQSSFSRPNPRLLCYCAHGLHNFPHSPGCMPGTFQLSPYKWREEF